MRIYLGFILCIFSIRAWATPQKIEMIFLSPQKVTELLELIEKKTHPEKIFNRTVLNEPDLTNCVPMGDGCFDPQLGYIEKKPEITNHQPVLAVPKDPELQLKTFSAIDTSLVNCDKGNYFDIFCGKEKPREKPSEIEIWFDVSSSLRNVDYNKENDQCNRRVFAKKVLENCKDKIKFSIFNTALKEAGELSSVCLANGTNDEAKLLQWMKDSEAKVLIIVTDIDEMSTAMKDYLSDRGAKMVGDGVKAFTSTDLINYANDIGKTCKK